MADWWKTRPKTARSRYIAMGVMFIAAVALVWLAYAMEKALHTPGFVAATYEQAVLVAGAGGGLAVVAEDERAPPGSTAGGVVYFRTHVQVQERSFLGSTLSSSCSWSCVVLGTRGMTTAGVIDSVRDDVASQLTNRGGSHFDVPAMFRRGVTSARVWHWRGFAGVGAKLAAVALIIAGIVFGWHQFSREEVSIARLRDGLCPRCRYSVRGLAPSAVSCPECGHELGDLRRVKGNDRRPD